MKKILPALFFVIFAIVLIVIGFILAINFRNQSGFNFIDTDGGRNYFIEGSTLGYRAFWEKIPRNIYLEHDSCTTICQGSIGSGIATSGPCLIEFYLDSKNYAAFDGVQCEKGCENGACLK